MSNLPSVEKETWPAAGKCLREIFEYLRSDGDLKCATLLICFY